MTYMFAVVPEETNADDSSDPIAAFASIEDAYSWALHRFKGKSFRLRGVEAVSPREGRSSERGAA